MSSQQLVDFIHEQLKSVSLTTFSASFALVLTFDETLVCGKSAINRGIIESYKVHCLYDFCENAREKI